MMFMVNREVRKVPVGWEHPKDVTGRYVPMISFDLVIDEDDYDEEDEVDETPRMPDVGDEYELVMYETTSEGTPDTPSFPNTPEGRDALVNYCVEHCTTFGSHRADKDGWKDILFGNAVVVDSIGRVS